MPQAKIYQTTPHFKKFQALAKNPAKRIVDVIRPISKKVDDTKDWEAITKNIILPFLQNPLTKQTGTNQEKKSLKEFVEECKKEEFMTLSSGKDGVGRTYELCMKYNKRKKSVAFIIKRYLPSLNEDGTVAEEICFGPIDISTVNVMIPSISTVENNQWSQKALWDAHFKVSCEFNAIVNRNCLCEHRYKLASSEHEGKFAQPCKHKKACNSTVCFAHLHQHCVTYP